MNVVKILAKKQYGRWVYHPVCDKALLFTRIAGTRTITSEVFGYIKDLGFTINLTHEVSSIHETVEQ